MFQFDNHCCLVTNFMSATLFDFLCQPRPPSPFPTQSVSQQLTSAAGTATAVVEEKTSEQVVTMVPIIHPR